MPRANRYFLSGLVWHITHRCHKKDFLLKFSKDRSAWIHWLFEARKRYGIEVLNFTVTSNHIHLLVYGNKNPETIPRSLQLVAGRTAQAFNQRKMRKGAFWEDRYHATAIDSDDHFIRCMIYIDLNMVRAGRVRHPSEWPHCGYNEIINPPYRYRIIARNRLAQLMNTSPKTLSDTYRQRVDESISQDQIHNTKENAWTNSIAVGRFQFVEEIKDRLGRTARTRQLETGADEIDYTLRESLAAYNADFDSKMDGLRPKNNLSWKIFDEI